MVNSRGVDCFECVFECVLEVVDTIVAGEHVGFETLPIIQEEVIELCPNLKKSNRKMSICNRLDLETLGY